MVRGVYACVDKITGAGFEKVSEPEIADRFDDLIEVLAAREPAIPGRLPETGTDARGAQA